MEYAESRRYKGIQYRVYHEILKDCKHIGVMPAVSRISGRACYYLQWEMAYGDGCGQIAARACGVLFASCEI